MNQRPPSSTLFPYSTLFRTSAASAALSVTIDTTAPVAPSIASFSPDSATVGDGITNVSVLTITATPKPNTAVNVFDGATHLGTVITPVPTTLRLTTPTPPSH